MTGRARLFVVDHALQSPTTVLTTRWHTSAMRSSPQC
jgi:hypothetical protein